MQFPSNCKPQYAWNFFLSMEEKKNRENNLNSDVVMAMPINLKNFIHFVLLTVIAYTKSDDKTGACNISL